MAIVRAVKSGNWSDVTVWNTGALPTSADDVYSNTFTVTIDQSFTVLSIQSGATTGVTAGGGFTCNVSGVTLACTGAGFVFNGTQYGTVFNVSANNFMNFVGNMSVGKDTQWTGSGTFNITGNITSTTNIVLLSFTNTSLTFNITGTLTANGGAIIDTNNGSTNTYNIIGNCINNGGSVFYRIGSSVTIKVTGSLTPFNNVPVVSFTATSPTVLLTGPFYVSSNGTHAVAYAYWKWFNTGLTPTFYQVRTSDLSTIRTLYTADSVGGNPAVTNVRSGTVYGPNSELTGTCAVPAAGSVALGVPVDNTTGTAILTQQNVLDAATTALTAASAVTFNQSITTLTTPNSIGERLKNAATVATVSQQISDVFSSRQ